MSIKLDKLRELVEPYRRNEPDYNCGYVTRKKLLPVLEEYMGRQDFRLKTIGPKIGKRTFLHKEMGVKFTSHNVIIVNTEEGMFVVDPYCEETVMPIDMYLNEIVPETNQEGLRDFSI